MTKKAEIFVTDVSGKPIGDFKSKTLTKLFTQLEKGTVINFEISEDGLPKQYVGNYVIRGTQGEQPEPEPPIPPEPEPQPPEPEPQPPEPEPTPGTVLYDSKKDSKLHDGKTRTITKEGEMTANGLGVECHASGNPRINVNSDGTFSLICDAGHGRFYGYVLNYDAALEIEFAFWNGDGDASLKMRSRHNEGGVCENRFGGYGFAIDQHSSYDAKRELCHNEHDEPKSGSIPKIGLKEYHKVRFEVRDEGNTVVQIAKIDDKEVMKKVDNSPKPYMTKKADFAQQSYYWVRSNVTSGTTELRIKSLKILKI